MHRDPAPRARSHCCTLYRQVPKRTVLLSQNTPLQLWKQPLNALAIVQMPHGHLPARPQRWVHCSKLTRGADQLLHSSEFHYVSDTIALLFPFSRQLPSLWVRQLPRKHLNTPMERSRSLTWTIQIVCGVGRLSVACRHMWIAPSLAGCHNG